MTGDWRRLHPLSPVVRGGRGLIAVVVILIPSLLRGGDTGTRYALLAVAVFMFAMGFIRWLVTRWRIDDDDLRIEAGFIGRRSLRFPLAQVQAIDIVRPGLARLLGVAELRLRMGGSSGGSARLAYLRESEVEPLRTEMLRLAHGAPEAGPDEVPAWIAEHLVSRVSTWRLIVSILITESGVLAEGVLVVLVVVGVIEPGAAAGLFSGGAAWAVGAGTQIWRRFNQEYNLTVAEGPDGLHVRGGLVALTAETIRPGRVQALRLVEPAIWRLLGWCRLEVDLAGKQKSEGEGRAQRGQLRALLPVGNRATAEELIDRLMPDRPRELVPPPRRARWKSPLRYSLLAYGRTDTCVATRSGRLRRVTVWVPLEKAQSLRLVQGPLQRRLNVASVHVDVAGKALHAIARDRDATEAQRELDTLAELARAARNVA
ncbi:MAG TPA: PH domain-containing protein [Gaiellaceae bacterium]|jgi:putative membrane protein